MYRLREMEWADWNCDAARRYTIGIEEEVMLLDPVDHSLLQCSESVLPRLSDGLAAHASPETHASVIELATGVHDEVGGAVAELAALREQLAAELRVIGLAVASAGTYPLASPEETRLSGTGRYSVVAESMRSIARREPTLALHVHVGVPDPDDAVRVLNGLRNAVPLLLALSANSPFCRGRDSGFASARTVIFQGFPRTGTARRFSCYGDYTGAVDALITSGAIPDPTFLWWDVRLQPALGTVEVRVMDAQSALADSSALIALVRALARLALEDEPAGFAIGPEVLAENRFLAARDGLAARLVDPAERRLVPVRALVDALLARCRRHADEIGAVELDGVARLMLASGADRQRAWAREHGLPRLVPLLIKRYAGSGARSGQRARSARQHEGAFG